MEEGEGTSTAYRVARILVALGSAAVPVLLLLVLVGAPQWFPGTPDCAVTTRDQPVELSTDEAQSAASAAAKSVRLGVPLRTASVAVAEVLDIPEQDGRNVASALTGRSRHALSCRHGGSDDEEPDRLDRSGLTGRAAALRGDLDRAFGSQQVGGFAPGGVSSGHAPGSAHYEGRAVDFFFRPANKPNKTKGWAMAQYVVAHAERLEVETVIFDGRIWTARRAGEGWRSYSPDTTGRSAEVAAVLEHRDHVHVDVAG